MVYERHTAALPHHDCRADAHPFAVRRLTCQSEAGMQQAVEMRSHWPFRMGERKLGFPP